MSNDNYRNSLGAPNQQSKPRSDENGFSTGIRHDFGLSVAPLAGEITANRRARLLSMPKIRRLSMIPSPTHRNPLRRLWRRIYLQHLRLLFGDGFRWGHRAIFSMGVMAYASALLWFIFLILNTVKIALQSLLPPIYFSSEPSLFPIWPQWHSEWAMGLLSTTAVLLFLPKLLSLLLILRNREARPFGGPIPLCASIVSEIFVSMLLAPVRMWFHSKFIVLTLIGKQIKWGSQCRTDNETGWVEAIRLHGFSTLLAFLLRDAESMAALHHGMWHMGHSYWAREPALTQVI